MIFTVPMKPINVDGELQFSYAINTKKGQIIKREDWLEQPNLNNIEYYPGNNKIAKSLNNYIMTQGKIKVTYTWEDGEISEEDIEEYKKLCADLNVEDPYANWSDGNNSISWILEYPACVKDWTDRSLAWEPKTKTASLEILEDDTVILCVLQENFGWDYKNVDLDPGEEIDCEKKENLNYLFFGNDCLITVQSPDVVGETFTYQAKQNEIKELTSNKCTIKNTSDKPCKVVLLCKS
tara:strand:+ start:1245 stop:1955 length:711 start_codon:yes stop_codon:yes gene_type:complete